MTVITKVFQNSLNQVSYAQIRDENGGETIVAAHELPEDPEEGDEVAFRVHILERLRTDEG